MRPAPRRDGAFEARIEAVATALAGIGAEGVSAAVVLGSGMGGLADGLARARRIEGREIEALPRSRVPGHAGFFAVGEFAGQRVLVQSGRVHLYEGHSARDVSLAVRAFARLNVKVLVLTNAAGGLHPEWEPGTLMAIHDHINLQGDAPLSAGEGRRDSAAEGPWDPALHGVLLGSAEALGEPLKSGVYAGVLGPSYETPAEVRALGWMGADAVGMSTVAEALAAAAEGLAVAGIACISNAAAGLAPGALDHGDVLAIGRASAARLQRLLTAALPGLLAAAR